MRTYLTFIKTLIIVFACILTGYAHGVEVRDLDDASIKVESRGKGERTKALKEALSQVLIKNTGNTTILSHELVKEKLRTPSSMLSQYRYIEQEDELVLLASFDHKRLLSLLRQAQAPIWGKQRPLTLVWLVNETQFQRQLIGDISIEPARDLLVNAASHRALPLLLPLMDLDDVMAVGVADVRGGFIDIVGRASERYQAEFFALASLALEPSTAEMKYKLDLYEQNDYSPFSSPLLHIESSADNKQDAVDMMTSELARFYSSRYGVSDSGQQLSSQVAFDGVDELSKLVAIESYLKQLTAVKMVHLKQVEDSRVTFDIELFGSEEDLLKQLKLEPNINALNIDGNDIGIDESNDGSLNIATFIWLGN